MAQQPSIRLRPARPGELPRLADIQTESLSADGLDLPADVRLLQHAIAWSNGIPAEQVICVADMDGEPIGWCEIGWFDEPSGLRVYRFRPYALAQAHRQMILRLVIVEAQARLTQVRKVHAHRGEWTYGTWCHDAEADHAAVLAELGFATHRRMIAMEREIKDGDAEVPLPQLPPGITFRTIREDDLPAVAKFYAQVELQSPDANVASAFMALPDWCWQVSVICLAGEGLAGAALTRLRPTGPYIEWIAVMESLRRNQIGQSLLAAAQSKLVPVDGDTVLCLDVAKENSVARACYQRARYVEREHLRWRTLR